MNTPAQREQAVSLIKFIKHHLPDCGRVFVNVSTPAEYPGPECGRRWSIRTEHYGAVYARIEEVKPHDLSLAHFATVHQCVLGAIIKIKLKDKCPEPPCFNGELHKDIRLGP